MFDALSTRPIRTSWLSPTLLTVVAEHAPHRLADAVESAVPVHGIGLLRPAVALSDRLVRALSANVSSPQRAGYLLRLARRLIESGDKPAALNAAQKAVTIYRRLAEAEPRYFVEYTTSLLTLAQCLDNIGKKKAAWKNARKSVTIWRNLSVPSDPEIASFNLATALAELGLYEAGLGEAHAALKTTEEAVAIYRRLAETDPELFLPHLASSLNNLSTQQADLGKKNAALETVEEAVRICRSLSDDEPGSHLRDLAVYSYNLSIRLTDADKSQAALEAAKEAVRIHRDLSMSEPDVHLPELAKMLNNLGQCLDNLGEKHAALETTRESVAIWRRLTKAEPDVHLDGLAPALSNLGVMLAEQNDEGAALNSAQEALTIWRRLPEAANYHLNLAKILVSSALTRSTLGVELGEALAYADEGITLFEDLAERLPDVFADHLDVARNVRKDIVDQLAGTGG